MNSLGTIGTIYGSKEKDCKRFDWKLTNFSSLEKSYKSYYSSPNFKFSANLCNLRMYTDGIDEHLTRGNIILFLTLQGNVWKHIHYLLGIKSKKGHVVECLTDLKPSRICCTGCKYLKFFSRIDLISEKSEFLPSDCLTISIMMRSTVIQLDRDAIVQTTSKDVSENQVCQTSRKTETVDVTVQTDIEDVFENEVFQTLNKTGGEKALDDIGNLLDNDRHSDFVVQIGDVEFKTHRAILATRSPFFNAVFQHDTLENTSNKLTITDSEPEIFKEFLKYIYTGTVNNLTPQNTFALHHVADKYLANDLKSQCLEYIKDILCVETFCETVELALGYNESELLKLSIDFASKNIGSIIRTVEWQRFITEFPIKANEILIKSIR